MVLPWHNPVLLAEQAATIDLLSGGRLDFGVGKGYRHNEFAAFCIPMEEADERFEESLALIIKSWTSNERFSHHGKYWHFENIIVEPPTAAEAASADLDGGRQPGFDPQGGAARLQAAARSARLDGSSPSSASTSTRPRSRPAAAHSIRWMSASAAPSLSQERRGEGKGRSRRGRQPDAAGESRRTRRTAEQHSPVMLSFDQTLDAAAESAMFGTPDEIAVKLKRLRDAGIEHMLLTGPAGSRENLRAFAREHHAGVLRTGHTRATRASFRNCDLVSASTRLANLRRHSAADQAQHRAVRAVAILRRRRHPARLRHRPADGHCRHRLGEPRRPHGRAVRRQPLPRRLSGRQDHRPLTAASPASCSARRWR